MPYHDDEYPGQPLYQSVLLFCCKGLIEVIMVVLFFWLLVQVLFSKQLEVHLQILLLVGLVVFFLSLILGCILCWRDSRVSPVKDKDSVTSAPAPAAPLAFSETTPPSAAMTASRQKYEELDGDVYDYPSTFTSPAPSDGELSSQPFFNQTTASSEQEEDQKSYFSLRRFSSPALTSPLYKSIESNHSSLPAFAKLGLLSKTCKALQKHCTGIGDNTYYDEHSRLTSPISASPLMAEEAIPLASLSYGSGASCQQPISSKPYIHFTMAFSSEHQTLAVTVLRLSGIPHSLEDVSVLGSLWPLYPCPLRASLQSSLESETHSMVLLLTVSSVEELQRCIMKIVVCTKETPGMSDSMLGEVEARCRGKDWRAELPLHFMQELNTKRSKLKMDAPVCKALSCSPQILILLQYQSQFHRIKSAVLRTDYVDNSDHCLAAPEYQVVINLHHEGAVISRKEAKGRSSTVWNAPFLFDLPPGDISQLHLTLEFIVVQVLSEGKTLSRVRIGADAADTGRAHWRDMCNLQGEQSRWHAAQPEPI